MAIRFASNITIQITHSVNEIDPELWDKLSGERPFQSHRWYQFGECVMGDCEPTYLLAYRNEELIGRAALWMIHNEPLPIGPGIGRALLQATLRRWPLLICRSPLSNATGLILPLEPLRAETLSALSQAALTVGRQRHCLMLVFDFLTEEESCCWQGSFSQVKVSDPGTIMQNRWQSLEQYLANGNKKKRQHYKRTLREAAKIGIRLETYKTAPDVNAVLELIHTVDRHYNNEPNPWMRGLIENMEMVNGTWLEARQNGKLVGCGALFEDNNTQLTTALGLADNVPYVYLLLTYASLEDAIKKKVRLLRWGSGSYNVKKQLGFDLEENNFILVSGTNFITQMLLKSFS